jgi:hypothetical protein
LSVSAGAYAFENPKKELRTSPGGTDPTESTGMAVLNDPTRFHPAETASDSGPGAVPETVGEEAPGNRSQ